MTARRIVATAVLAFFLTGLVPASSFAAPDAIDSARQSGASVIGLREAGRKAVTELVKDGSTHATLAVPSRPATSRRAQSATGGGSKVLPIVLTLVGVAASAGVTYYAVKELKKTAPPTSGQ